MSKMMRTASVTIGGANNKLDASIQDFRALNLPRSCLLSKKYTHAFAVQVCLSFY
jgi:hypothetical protein